MVEFPAAHPPLCSNIEESALIKRISSLASQLVENFYRKPCRAEGLKNVKHVTIESISDFSSRTVGDRVCSNENRLMIKNFDYLSTELI